MLKKMKANQVVNGSFGSLWIDNEKLSNIKSFEAKVELNYEEVNIAEDLGTHQKLMGYAGSGTMTLHKVDSFVLKKMKDGLAQGLSLRRARKHADHQAPAACAGLRHLRHGRRKHSEGEPRSVQGADL